MNKSMGQIIKGLRKERNLTQEELAERLNVTSQAVSKWENETGMPDISQIIPLASVFGVSTDFLFGIEGTTADEEAMKLIHEADEMMEYGRLDSYLAAWEKLTAGLKSYPNNHLLLHSCAELGLSLSLPENGWLYAGERAKEIADETIRQANLIISCSRNITDILRAHQILVLIYSAAGDFVRAASEAQSFPVRTDFTFYSNMAIVNEYKKDYAGEISSLCSDIDYSLQQLENNAAKLGKAYLASGDFRGAISVYESFFAIMKAIFKDDCPPPYHDFDSGDCYILLAEAYLAIGDNDKAMDSVERSITYWLGLAEKSVDGRIMRKALMNSPLVKETQADFSMSLSALKEKLIEKLFSAGIEPLRENERFRKLYERINRIDL